MNEKIRSLVEAANADFNGSTPDDLQRYCEELSILTRSNTTDSWRLTKLREAVSVGAQTGVIETLVVAPRNIAGKRLNLMPGGRWEGRRRIININENEQDQRSSWKEISWNGSTILVHTGMDVALPYPHYEVLKNAIHVVIQRKQAVASNGQVYIEETEKHLKALPFTDMGDDPATKDLPRSFIERAQGEFRSRDYYKGAKREHMIRMLDDLTDRSIPRERTREMADEEIREQLCNLLGLYEEVQETKFALDNAA